MMYSNLSTKNKELIIIIIIIIIVVIIIMIKKITLEKKIEKKIQPYYLA